jgi:hypothetical protein
MRISQGDNVLGGAIAGLRNVLSQVGMLVWIQCVANKERVIAREKEAQRFTDEEIGLLSEALDMAVAEVPMKMAFTVKVTDAERTFEQQRMNMMTLTQMYAQYATQTIPLAMQIYGPQGQQMQQQAPEMYAYMGRIMVGSAKMMEDIFRFFNIYNTKDYVPDAEKMDQMMDLIESMSQGFAGAQNLQAPGAAPQGVMPPQEQGMQGAPVPEGSMA